MSDTIISAEEPARQVVRDLRRDGFSPHGEDEAVAVLIAAAIRAAEEAMRERCALVCDEYRTWHHQPGLKRRRAVIMRGLQPMGQIGAKRPAKRKDVADSSDVYAPMDERRHGHH
jgi:hypothetical protein